MVFGEIVEPSSRAYIFDEYDDYPEDYESSLEWTNPIPNPDEIKTLLIVETKFVIDVIHNCLKGLQIISKCENSGLILYKMEGKDDVYILTCSLQEIVTGEVVEVFIDWIKKANKIYTITSSPKIAYQVTNNVNLENVYSFMRCLQTKIEEEPLFKKLETPNIVTGVGANFFSYCVFIKRSCQLFIGYVDNAPVDSANAQPFVELLKKIGVMDKNAEANFKFETPNSNLYM